MEVRDALLRPPKNRTGGGRIRQRSRTKNQHKKEQKRRKLAAATAAVAAASAGADDAAGGADSTSLTALQRSQTNDSLRIADLRSRTAAATPAAVSPPCVQRVELPLPLDCIRAIMACFDYPFAVSLATVCTHWSYAMNSHTRRIVLLNAARATRADGSASASASSSSSSAAANSSVRLSGSQLRWAIHSLDSLYVGMHNYSWLVRSNSLFRHTFAMLAESICQSSYCTELAAYFEKLFGAHSTDERLLLSQSACKLHAALSDAIQNQTPNKTLLSMLADGVVLSRVLPLNRHIVLTRFTPRITVAMACCATPATATTATSIPAAPSAALSAHAAAPDSSAAVTEHSHRPHRRGGPGSRRANSTPRALEPAFVGHVCRQLMTYSRWCGAWSEWCGAVHRCYVEELSSPPAAAATGSSASASAASSGAVPTNVRRKRSRSRSSGERTLKPASAAAAGGGGGDGDSESTCTDCVDDSSLQPPAPASKPCYGWNAVAAVLTEQRNRLLTLVAQLNAHSGTPITAAAAATAPAAAATKP